MPKLVLFASLLLLAYGVNAASVSIETEESTNPIVVWMDEQIEALNNAGVEVLDNVKDWTESLETKVEESLDSFEDSWNNALTELNAGLDEKIAEIDDSLNTEECIVLRNEITADANKLNAEIRACENATLEEGYALKEKWEATVQSWNDTWGTYNAEVEACFTDNANDSLAIIEIPVCLAAVEAKYVVVFPIQFATVSAALVELKAEYDAIESKEAACVAWDQITAFQQTSLEDFGACLANVAGTVLE